MKAFWVRGRLFGAMLAVLGTPAAAGELSNAVAANDLGRVQALLATGLNVNERGLDGTPLHIAADQGNIEIAKAFPRRRGTGLG